MNKQLYLNSTIRRGFRARLALLHFALMAAASLPGALHAAINVGSVTVNSIGHRFTPPRLDPPPQLAGVVQDLLIDQLQAGGGGATNAPVSLNLNASTQVSFTISAPSGQKFLVTVPAGSSAQFEVDFGWWTGIGDAGFSQGFSASFQGLEGSAPAFTNIAVVGNNNQFFTFNSDSGTFANTLAFRAVTFTVTYSARNIGGVLNYNPFDPRVRNDYHFSVLYRTSGNSDPGRFVTLVSVLPVLSVRLTGANTVVLSWPNPSTGYIPQQSANMNGPGGGWTLVSQTPVVVGPNKEVTLPATGRFCMFRLSQ